MSAARKSVLMATAQALRVPVNQADAAAVQLLSLLTEEVADGGAIFVRHRKATSEGLRETYVRLNLGKLVDGALEREQ